MKKTLYLLAFTALYTTTSTAVFSATALADDVVSPPTSSFVQDEEEEGEDDNPDVRRGRRNWFRQFGFGAGDSEKMATKVVAAFGNTTASTAPATVRVICDGKEAAYGLVIDAEGHVLTKASQLLGDVKCKLTDKRVVDAELLGVSREHDLAMLKLSGSGYPYVELKERDDPEVGAFLVTVGQRIEPLAIGVVSVPTRKIPSGSGILGIGLATDGGPARVTQVLPESGAENAGMKVDDVVTRLNGEKVEDGQSLIQMVRKFKPGDQLVLHVKRGENFLVITATLGSREEGGRGEFQNQLGGSLSVRRAGFDEVLQHDTVLSPTQCGGPVLDLDGKLVGLNIARAGRVVSYLLPTTTMITVIDDLKSGKLAIEATLDKEIRMLKERVESLRASEKDLATQFEERKATLEKVKETIAKLEAEGKQKQADAAKEEAEKVSASLTQAEGQLEKVRLMVEDSLSELELLELASSAGVDE